MNYLKIQSASALLALILTFSCTDPAVSFARVEFSIPDHINVKADDFKSAFGEFKTDPSSNLYIVVVIYSYSSGRETISFSGGDDVKTVSGSGRLKALVKVMDGKKIIRAEFVEGEGNNKEEIISSLVKDFRLKY